jgi:Skp family chaperone for outer membrane proteins
MNSKIDKLSKIVAAAAIAGGSMFASPTRELPYINMSMPVAYADTVYYGGDVKNKKTPAYIEFDKVKVQSKYFKQIPAQNDPNYNKVIQKMYESVYNSVFAVAASDGYDVVVERGDPTIAGYKDISDLVVKQMKESEK